jgi:precorrin-2/cobalt-factor-2 C20-methyltransferase
MTAPSSTPPARLTGVGVGPGDPGLITLQALGALDGADRVVAPSTAPDAVGRAESVVRQVRPHLRIDRIAFPMGRQAPGAPASGPARELIPWLDAGEHLAFVTLGDPNMYSTFSSVAAQVRCLRPAVEIATVPGIMAFQALAALAGVPLAEGNAAVSLVTALDGTEALAHALEDPSRAVVVYKGGRHLPAMAKLLEEAGRLEGAVAGELLGLPGQRVGPVADLAGSPAAYLVTVIVPPGGEGEGQVGA